MPKAARLKDKCTGHSSWPPRPNNQASTNVFINGRGAHRLGDSWESHTSTSTGEKHTSTTAVGSPTVFVNGKPLARIDDRVACGSSIATGSNNVIVDSWIDKLKILLNENSSDSNQKIAYCILLEYASLGYLAAKTESELNPKTFNNCDPNDPGGCSYGWFQFTSETNGLTYLLNYLKDHSHDSKFIYNEIIKSSYLEQTQNSWRIKRPTQKNGRDFSEFFNQLIDDYPQFLLYQINATKEEYIPKFDRIGKDLRYNNFSFYALPREVQEMLFSSMIQGGYFKGGLVLLKSTLLASALAISDAQGISNLWQHSLSKQGYNQQQIKVIDEILDPIGTEFIIGDLEKERGELAIEAKELERERGDLAIERGELYKQLYEGKDIDKKQIEEIEHKIQILNQQISTKNNAINKIGNKIQELRTRLAKYREKISYQLDSNNNIDLSAYFKNNGVPQLLTKSNLDNINRVGYANTKTEQQWMKQELTKLSYEDGFAKLIDVYWHTYSKTPNINAYCRTIQDELIDNYIDDLENTNEFDHKTSKKIITKSAYVLDT